MKNDTRIDGPARDTDAVRFLRHLVRFGWRKAMAGNVTANDNHRQIDRIYRMPDPWNLASRREASRFEQTLAFLESRVGRVGALLEIGCGEGHQSLYLSRICDRLYGIDVSPTAVARARTRLPQATFAATDIHNLPWHPQGGYDLVVACEVLYYMRDIPAALDRMNALGAACLVTFFGPAAEIVAPHLVSLPNVERGWFFHDPYPWLFAFWRGDRSPGIDRDRP